MVVMTLPELATNIFAYDAECDAVAVALDVRWLL